MFKKFIFLSLCFFSPLMAQSTPTTIDIEQENLQIGRYQMVISRSATLYLLDTTTGFVWKSTNENTWLTHDSWELLIATPPKQAEQ